MPSFPQNSTRTRNISIPIITLSLLLGGCAGASIDWASIGGAAVEGSCARSSHCDLPCSRDPKREDCVTGGSPR